MLENLKDLLEALRAFSRILVTGPQRSGTTIAAKIIAKELKYRFLDELDIKSDGNLWPEDVQKALANPDPFLKLIGPAGKELKGIVVQSAGISYWAHRLAEEKNLAVVFCVRDLDEIYTSQLNWGWLGCSDYRTTVIKYRQMPELADKIDGDANPAKMAYMAWFDYQQYQLEGMAFEFWYRWLKDTPYWVPTEKRVIERGWGFKSTGMMT